MFLNGKRIKIKIDGEKRVGIVLQHHIHMDPVGVPGQMVPGPVAERIEIELLPRVHKAKPDRFDGEPRCIAHSPAHAGPFRSGCDVVVPFNPDPWEDQPWAKSKPVCSDLPSCSNGHHSASCEVALDQNARGCE